MNIRFSVSTGSPRAIEAGHMPNKKKYKKKKKCNIRMGADSYRFYIRPGADLAPILTMSKNIPLPCTYATVPDGEMFKDSGILGSKSAPGTCLHAGFVRDKSMSGSSRSTSKPMHAIYLVRHFVLFQSMILLTQCIF